MSTSANMTILRWISASGPLTRSKSRRRRSLLAFCRHLGPPMDRFWPLVWSMEWSPCAISRRRSCSASSERLQCGVYSSFQTLATGLGAGHWSRLHYWAFSSSSSRAKEGLRVQDRRTVLLLRRVRKPATCWRWDAGIKHTRFTGKQW